MCWAAVVLALLTVVSCKDDDKDAVSSFAVDQTEVQFANNGGEFELKVATDQTWTAEAENDWCMVSPATGIGSGICVVKTDSSYLYKERTGRIVFYSDKGDIAEVQVKQFGYEPTIDLTKAEVTIPSYAVQEKAYVDVEAIGNVPFEVVIPEEAKQWLSIEGTSTYTPSTTIPRKQAFRFRFKTYTDFMKDRIAEVEFKQTSQPASTTRAEGSMLEKIVKIIQEKAPTIIPSRKGDSLAVLSVVRGLNANLGFSPSLPITHWNNVLLEERTYDYKDPITGYEKKDTTELRVIGLSITMLDTNESLPYQIKYLTELETFAAIANGNAFLRKIALGPEITELKKLKSLSLMGYGINTLPPEMANMERLEELDLNGNTILDLNSIKDILLGLKDHLKSLDIGGNRVADAVLNLKSDIPKDKTLETIGMGGNLNNYDWLFSSMNALEELRMSYNYFYGSIPALGDVKEGVLPNMKALSLNLNRLSGKVPNWILYHPKLACWDPFILLFSQEGYDNTGAMAIFTNAPTKFADFPADYNRTCPDDEKSEAEAVKLPPLTQDELNAVPLHGHWRYYRMLNQKWYLNCKRK